MFYLIKITKNYQRLK